jgi:hypothetical protein
MAVAKNLALQHYWGIANHTFASTSSSPFYTFLLAGSFKVFGVHEMFPLLFNIAAGIIALVVIHRWLKSQKLTRWAQLLILLSVNFLTPLPLLVISGMEHTFQLLFTFLFLFSFASGATATRLPWTTFAYGMLMVSTRYECLPILGFSCLILLFRRRVGEATVLGAISVLPIALFGLYALSKGSYFLPNSVLLKAGLPHSLGGWARFASDGIWRKLFFSLNDYNFLAAQRLLLLLPLTFLLFAGDLRGQPAYRIVLLILTGASLAHIAFAFPANFPRYEDYLIGCSVVIVGTIVAKYGTSISLPASRGIRWIGGAVLIGLFMPFVIRTEKSFRKSAQYCINIYEQQYQMAQFVHAYYDSASLAFNDIGAISFFSKGDKLDVWGLANIEVAKAKKNHYWTPAYADTLIRMHRTRIALLYDNWVDPTLRNQWTKVACWHNGHNVVLGEDSVSFFAIHAGDAAELRQNLKSYQPRLPRDVGVTYY